MISTPQPPYNALPPRSIRLLQISPSHKPDDPIQCSLSTIPLHSEDDDDNDDNSSNPSSADTVDIQPFIALSYMWGTAIDPSPISLNDTPMQVTKNLASALRHLRQASASKSLFLSPAQFRARTFNSSNRQQEERKEEDNASAEPFFWIDALCINQADVQERTAQVQLMRDIYSRAEKVVTWLGPDDNEEYRDAIALIKLVAAQEASSRYDNIPNLCFLTSRPTFTAEETLPNNIIANKAWSNVRELLTAAYWERIWVQQEMALARQLHFLIGHLSFTYDELSSYMSFISQLQILGNRVAHTGVIPERLWSNLLLPDLLNPRGVQFVQDLKEVATNPDFYDDAHLIQHVLFAQECRATDPRDKIFGLQGLLKNLIVPDYGKSTRDVYCEFAWKHVQVSGHLEILQYAGVAMGNPNPFGLPSWVPDWHALSLPESGKP